MPIKYKIRKMNCNKNTITEKKFDKTQRRTNY